MKKILVFAMALVTFACCSMEKTYRYITPLPAGVNVDSLKDCTIPVSFTCADFDWIGGNLAFTVFNEDIYDVVDLAQMEIGDTVLCDGREIVVDSIENENGFITINGGLDMGGCWFQAYEGGTYRAVQFDDHSLYTELGSTILPLAEDFIIVDCGANPDDPSDTIRTNQKMYLEKLADYKQKFSVLDTKVLVENGVITEINRRWIP